MQEQEV